MLIPLVIWKCHRSLDPYKNNGTWPTRKLKEADKHDECWKFTSGWQFWCFLHAFSANPLLVVSAFGFNPSPTKKDEHLKVRVKMSFCEPVGSLGIISPQSWHRKSEEVSRSGKLPPRGPALPYDLAVITIKIARGSPAKPKNDQAPGGSTPDPCSAVLGQDSYGHVPCHPAAGPLWIDLQLPSHGIPYSHDILDAESNRIQKCTRKVWEVSWRNTYTYRI